MTISKTFFDHEAAALQGLRVSSKKFVQQGRSHFDAQSVLVVREQGKMARTLLAAFFNGTLYYTYGRC